MESYKIYRQENYIKISGKQDWYGLVKDVFIDKSNVKKAEYRFFNIKDWNTNISLSIGQIQKEDGTYYTEQEFDTFYNKNTGNFKSPDIGATFVNTTSLPTTDIDMNSIYVLPDSSWNIYNGTYWVKEDVEKVIYEEVVILPTVDIKTNIIYILPDGSWNVYNGTNWIKGNTQFEIVNTYNDLPTLPTDIKWYWVSNSQGIQWLPGSLGGTYYPKGIYYNNGTNWEHIETPYQATQDEVDIGTNNDKFVTPQTLKNNIQNALSLKQDTLVSGTNIKTINGSSVLGSGNLTISGGVTGSGLVNQVSYWSGATSQVGSNSFLYDDASKRLELTCETTSGSRGFFINQISNNIGASAMTFSKARGTLVSPANANTLDLVGAFVFRPRLNGAYTSDRALFGGNVVGTNGIGMYFCTGTTDGSYTPALYLHPSRNVVIGTNDTILTGVTDSGFKLDVNGTVRVLSGINVQGGTGANVLLDNGTTSPLPTGNVRVINQLTDITTTSTTVVNTDLTFTIEANSVYTLEGYLYGGGASSGGARIGLSLPIGCTGIHSVLAFNLTTTTNGNPSVVDINTQITSFAQSNNAQQTRYIATLITGANAGNVTLQFGTHAAGQTSIFRTFSHLKITKK